MKSTVIAILLLNIVLSVCGQEYNTHWIYAPQSDSTSHVWFRRAFISDGKPRQTSITVTSTGYYKLYVNECNVGTALFYPYREGCDTSAISTTFDITPYLRPDTNVVALLYSPSIIKHSQRQVSVNLYGKSHNGSIFSYVSDESWLCRRANSEMTTDGGEFIDGREHDPSWKAATIYNQALWLPAKEAKGISAYSNKRQTQALHLTHSTTYIPEDITTAEDGTKVLELPYGFYGFVRATIRDARRGEEITIGNIHYICNGQTDEQAYPLFSVGYQRLIPFKGDIHFNKSQLTFIDVLEVK